MELVKLDIFLKKNDDFFNMKLNLILIFEGQI
jgi:hypothetical protein